jgi:hypothetical protein
LLRVGQHGLGEGDRLFHAPTTGLLGGTPLDLGHVRLLDEDRSAFAALPGAAKCVFIVFPE